MKLLYPFTALLLFSAALPALRAEDLPRASAEEESAVRALLGKKATITGKVTDAFESPKGMTFLNLEGGKFTLVAWKDSYDKFEGGSPAKLYKDKTIEVTGQVFEFRPKGASKEDPGKLEIKVSSPDQIKVLTPAEPETKEDDKKEESKDSKEKSPKAKKDAKPPKDEKPSEAKKDTKPEPDKEKPKRVDPKKYFK